MPDQVQEVKQKTDIVSVIGTRVALKPSGKYLKGLCPFHAERSPSFFVSPDVQFFKCYGCGKGGDVFTFLQEYEGMTFRESLEILAEKAGVKLERYQRDEQEESISDQKQILSLAQEFFHYLLTSHSVGEAGRKYLQERHIPEGLISSFNLGFAPPSWDSLEKYLVGKKKFDPEIVAQTGLLIKRQGGRDGYYDRFRNRIMFPLKDFRGQVVGFSGRLLESEDDPEVKEATSTGSVQAKYINTPETALYHKRELLFGLHNARPAMRKKDQAILVEGEFDVISSFKAGVKQVAAIKGSALTKEHVQLLMRLTKNVVLCLDADSAGDAATKRGIELADKMGMNVSIIPIRQGKDPDQLVKTDPQQWKQLVKKPASIYEFYIESAFKRFDETTGTGKKQITQELVPVLAAITNSVEQAHYQDIVSKKLKVSTQVLQTEIDKYNRQKKLDSVPSSQKESAKDQPEMVKPDNRLEALEQQLWSWWLQQGNTEEALTKEWLRAEWYAPGIQQLVKHIETYYTDHQSFNIREFIGQLSQEMNQLVQHLYIRDVNNSDALSVDQAHALFQKANQLQNRQIIQDLTQQIADLERAENLSSDEAKKLEQLQSRVAFAIQKLHQS